MKWDFLRNDDIDMGNVEQVIDIRQIDQAARNNRDQGGLESILIRFSINQYCGQQHNAGNDAHITMHVLRTQVTLDEKGWRDSGCAYTKQTLKAGSVHVEKGQLRRKPRQQQVNTKTSAAAPYYSQPSFALPMQQAASKVLPLHVDNTSFSPTQKASASTSTTSPIMDTSAKVSLSTTTSYFPVDIAQKASTRMSNTTYISPVNLSQKAPALTHQFCHRRRVTARLTTVLDGQLDSLSVS